MIRIDPDEIRFSGLSHVDTTGRVFRWNGRLLRGIYPAAAADIRALFASGCIDELTARGLFPRSWISEFALEGFELVVEHEAIPYATYPHEWSFDMVRDAAVAVLDVWEVAARYGWRLKDAHPYNVLFHRSRPVWVDLGSFVRAGTTSGFSLADDLLSMYWRPLAIWATGDGFLGRRVVSSAFETMSSKSWCYYRHPLLRRLSPASVERIVSFRDRWYRRLARMVERRPGARSMAQSLLRHVPAEIVAGVPSLFAEKIALLRAPSPSSSWHDYQRDYVRQGIPASTPRFDRVIDFVRETGCRSVTELGGNRGVLSTLLLRETPMERAACVDADVDAIDWLYGFSRAEGVVPPKKSLQPVAMNFMIHEMDTAVDPRAVRLCSDAVIALALTHHLTLAQGFPISEVLRVIATYTREYALVEFMPLGLWNGERAPALPEWYNEAWFRRAFSDFFDIIDVQNLEPNRVLYIGRRLDPERIDTAVESWKQEVLQ